MIDNEILELEAFLDAPSKKSRKTLVPMEEIVTEVESEMGSPVLFSGRAQGNMNAKKVFCYVAMELGHHPKDVGERCGIDRSSAIHHWNSMKQVFWMCDVARKIGRK